MQGKNEALNLNLICILFRAYSARVLQLKNCLNAFEGGKLYSDVDVRFPEKKITQSENYRCSLSTIIALLVKQVRFLYDVEACLIAHT